jgi:hypothetical protein
LLSTVASLYTYVFLHIFVLCILKCFDFVYVDMLCNVLSCYFRKYFFSITHQFSFWARVRFLACNFSPLTFHSRISSFVVILVLPFIFPKWCDFNIYLCVPFSLLVFFPFFVWCLVGSSVDYYKVLVVNLYFYFLYSCF